MKNTEEQLWKGALLPASVVATISIILSAILAHVPGLWGSLLGSVTVILFFSVHLLVAKISKDLDPMATMALAMFSYFAKVVLMGAFLLIVTKTTSPESVNRISFAASALTITAAWLGGEIRAFLKLRFNLPLPQNGTTSSNPQGK
ncbi:MAG: hypothetical protein NTZ31_05750 [Actinobacteria bacterium]|jgi:hypothetical protein|nr:hypothetical protein [Actinomycetota bacterium]